MRGDDSSKEVRITYETLFEMFRLEKNRPELQKIPQTFFKDLVDYLNEKKKILEEAKTQTGLFVDEEKERAEKQIVNVKKLLIDLYEKREKKIVAMALDRSRISSDLVDTTNLLKEERQFFDKMTWVLDEQRKGVLFNILRAKIPFVQEPGGQKAVELEQGGGAEKQKEAAVSGEPEAETAGTTDKEEPKPLVKGAEKPEIKWTEPIKEPEKLKQEFKLVRFLSAVPKFIGKELELYGPFEEEDIATLPGEIADVLITKGRVEEIEEGY